MGSETPRCPTCGRGTLVEITFREGGDEVDDKAIQGTESRQTETYSCGHEVVGPRLEVTSESSALEVEHRTSDETVEPPDQGAGRSSRPIE
jgi:hypothetical protein